MVHLQEFPDEPLSAVLSNVFSFDSHDEQLGVRLLEVLKKHGITTLAAETDASLDNPRLLERRRKAAEASADPSAAAPAGTVAEAPEDDNGENDDGEWKAVDEPEDEYGFSGDRGEGGDGASSGGSKKAADPNSYTLGEVEPRDRHEGGGENDDEAPQVEETEVARLPGDKGYDFDELAAKMAAAEDLPEGGGGELEPAPSGPIEGVPSTELPEELKDNRARAVIQEKLKLMREKNRQEFETRQKALAVDEAAKRDVEESASNQAKRTAKRAYKRNLKDWDMSDTEVKTYERMLKETYYDARMIMMALMSRESRARERVWLRHQMFGELDDDKLVDGLCGERNVYKRRGEDAALVDVQKGNKKRVKFVMDISGSMYQNNKKDKRLTKCLQVRELPPLPPTPTTTTTPVVTPSLSLPLCSWPL